MNDGQITTSGAPLNEDAVRTLQSNLRGHIVLPEDSAYEEARTLYNAMIDKHPVMITRCHSAADVARTVTFAREQGLALSVRGGGHSVAGNALVDDGLVIDLSEMNGVTVDPETRTATVQGGAIWRDVDKATHEHGLATPGGTFSPTGVGGLTLGGGIAWLMRQYGLACDNLLRAEVVTASGEVINASETEYPDLFWALRGGCGNFGVVTEFEFRLHPVHTVFGGMIVHPIEQAREALQFYREFNLSAPDELTTFAGFMTTPEGHEVVAFVTCYSGDPERGEEVTKPLAEWGTPILKQIGPIPYPAFQQMLDETMPPGLENYWTADFLTDLYDDVIDIVIQHFRDSTSPLNFLLFEQLGGAMGRVPDDATAFPHRDARYNCLVIARWTDPAQADAQIAWARQVRADVQPYSTGGAYINYMATENQERIKAAYGADTYARLAAIKAKYDPDNVFRSTHNIQPAQ